MNDMSFNNSLVRLVGLLVVTCGSAQLSWGHGAGGDIAVFSEDGQAAVGFAILDDDDDVQEFFDPTENVFLSVLLPLNPNPLVPWDFGSSEPGFDANEASLPAEADITYNLLDLWYWNPNSGSEVTLSAVDNTITGGVAPQPEKTFPDGGFHSHPFFGVHDSKGLPAAGIYVGRLSISVDGLSDSDPYYMVSLVADEVLGQTDLDAQVEAAEVIGERVRQFVADPQANPAPNFEGSDFTYYATAVMHVRQLAMIPEPGTAALGTLSMLGLATLRRRRRLAPTRAAVSLARIGHAQSLEK